MTRAIDREQEYMWDSVYILSQIHSEKAKAVFKAAIEKSFWQLGLTLPVFSTIRFSLPNEEHLSRLRDIEKKMREAYTTKEQEKAYEYLVDYIEQLSEIAEGDSLTVRKKLLVSLLNESAKNNKCSMKNCQLPTSIASFPSRQTNVAYYTTTEVAKKLGLSDQTIRRMCETGKFPGAYKTDGGHWRIPQDIFVTTPEQDDRAEQILHQIDRKNQEAGDVDEFNL
ncbi:helix-turn-helix domain-containing protein [Anoxybacillus ayderensis]|uniref:DNA binding domain, excisionase family n=1 Tax=Anoxybacillus ayderensis TaxID=265546 RepID=A0A0D0GY20_9BACL|nr:helix-turn-helix domain-containing protein [Anoxybacillus ayderensis]EPZ38856.1 excisionase family DNA binding domain-containing protein [Anoxybacillus ayderensis]KHF27602.1 Helix-turn-helix domain protein [Anoxybacillus sp. BCO1]KIP20731.1 DNA binding domain, excisionase family [Anoxybacillus ayderensis]NNU97181.1 DNA-binding protein [Anoxybacillus sp. EFIL]